VSPERRSRQIFVSQFRVTKARNGVYPGRFYRSSNQLAYFERAGIPDRTDRVYNTVERASIHSSDEIFTPTPQTALATFAALGRFPTDSQRQLPT
jgi:hypothetical protein